MWPIGHGAVAYLLYSAATRRRLAASPTALAVILLGIGSQFPDLVDKPLAWRLDLLPAGRTLAHSLLVLVPLVVVLVALARRRGLEEYAVAFGVGAISHALVDAIPVVWDGDATADFLAWPLIAVSGPESGAPTILGLLRNSMGDPYFLLEFLLLGVALVLWRADGYPGLELVPGVTVGASLDEQSGR